jgi:hypothetical protein
MKNSTILKMYVFTFGSFVTSLMNTLLTYEEKCISFSVGPGTGCEWMCNYCATMLNTSNYYFSPDVCSYESGGCVGNPQTGVTYSCCSL